MYCSLEVTGDIHLSPTACDLGLLPIGWLFIIFCN
jgi:hypothetical protein